jgi:protein TonB
MLDKYYHTKDVYYSHEKMVAYLKGELEDYEKRAMEKLMEEDPLLKDAVEGIQYHGLQATEKSLQRLHKKTDILTGVRKPVVISMRARNLSIAAMLLVFMAVSYLMVTRLNWEQPNQTAMESIPEESNTGEVVPETTDADHAISATTEDLNNLEVKKDKGAVKSVSSDDLQPTLSTSDVADPVEMKRLEEVVTAGSQQEYEPNMATMERMEDLDEEVVASKTESKKKNEADMQRDDAYFSGTPSVSESAQDQIFTIVEQMPQYPGGDKALQKFIEKNLQYPSNAMENGVEGTVYISFVVEDNGSITSAKVIRGIGSGCDEEALRLVNNMPDWKPGKQDGENIRTLMTLPVSFRLQ